jgi:hypothetical protein
VCPPESSEANTKAEPGVHARTIVLVIVRSLFPQKPIVAKRY